MHIFQANIYRFRFIAVLTLICSLLLLLACSERSGNGTGESFRPTPSSTESASRLANTPKKPCKKASRTGWTGPCEDEIPKINGLSLEQREQLYAERAKLKGEVEKMTLEIQKLIMHNNPFNPDPEMHAMQRKLAEAQASHFKLIERIDNLLGESKSSNTP